MFDVCLLTFMLGNCCSLRVGAGVWSCLFWFGGFIGRLGTCMWGHDLLKDGWEPLQLVHLWFSVLFLFGQSCSVCSPVHIGQVGFVSVHEVLV